MTEFQTPHSEEFEMIVLGAMMTNINSFSNASQFLSPQDFYDNNHRLIFSTLQEHHQNNQPVDVHLVGESLKYKGKLGDVGGVAYLTTLCQYAGISVYIEEYVSDLKAYTIKRALLDAALKLIRECSSGSASPQDLIETQKINLSQIERGLDSRISLDSTEDGIYDLKEWLENTRGKSLLGLPQKRLPSLDTRLLGLRKLTLLAAPPNVGKTSFGIQMGLDVLLNNPEACVVIFSLEMSRRDLLIRLFQNISGIDFAKFVFGDPAKDHLLEPHGFFNGDDLENIIRAEELLLSLGKRLQIVDGEICPNLTAQKAIAYINDVKEQSGCNRVLVLVDYLQVWPLGISTKFYSELEMDKWRIQEMKKIRDSINDDPIIVISEARKPSQNGKWAYEMSDIMGSARGAYSPDIIFLYTPFSDDDLAKMWEAQKLNFPDTDQDESKRGEWVRGHLVTQGIGLYRLDIAKGRDGIEKGIIPLVFDFRTNSFRELDWGELKQLPQQRKFLNR